MAFKGLWGGCSDGESDDWYLTLVEDGAGGAYVVAVHPDGSPFVGGRLLHFELQRDGTLRVHTERNVNPALGLPLDDCGRVIIRR